MANRAEEIATSDLIAELLRRLPKIERCEPGVVIKISEHTAIAHRVISDCFQVQGDDFVIVLYPAPAALFDGGKVVLD